MVVIPHSFASWRPFGDEQFALENNDFTVRSKNEFGIFEKQTVEQGNLARCSNPQR